MNYDKVKAEFKRQVEEYEARTGRKTMNLRIIRNFATCSSIASWSNESAKRMIYLQDHDDDYDNETYERLPTANDELMPFSFWFKYRAGADDDITQLFIGVYDCNKHFDPIMDLYEKWIVEGWTEAAIENYGQRYL